MVVDVWAQPFDKRTQHLMPEALPLFKRSKSPIFDWEKTNTILSPSKVVELMDAANLDQVLLSAWHRPQGPVITNESILEYVAHSDRIFGIAAVDLNRPMHALE